MSTPHHAARVPVRRRACLAALFLAAALAACRESPAPPAAAAADTPAAAPRVAVLSPALAATMQDLGLEALVVGRAGWDLALDPALPVCGDQTGIDYERLLAVRPTHVLLEWGSRPLPPRLGALAADQGWTVRNFRLLSLGEVAASADALGEMFLPPRAGAEPAGDPFRRALARRADFSPAGRVLLLASLAPPAALGPGSFHHQALESIGGVPAFADGAPYIRLDAEDVLRLAPDAIILVLPRAPGVPAPSEPPTWDDLRARLGAIGTLDIPAVARRRVALIDDPLALLPATTLRRFADALADILARWSESPPSQPP